MISMVVVFPAPFGPSNPKHTPSGTASETPSTAVTEGYCLTRLRTSRIGSLMTGMLSGHHPYVLGMVTSQWPLWSDKDAAQGWVVRESHRARRLTVRVFHTGRVEVVVPSRTSAVTVERFVERHRTWIERKREEARARALPASPFPPKEIDLAACSERWQIHLTGNGRRVRLSTLGDGLLALDGDVSDARAVRQVLRRWLTERASEVLAPALKQCARELDFTFERVLIRRQRSRWGSCSTRGTISL